MKRVLVVCLGLIAGGCLLATTAAVSAAPRATLRGFVCKQALAPESRMVSVTAVMRPVHGTRQMQLKFDLIRRRRGGGRSKRVLFGDLGRWLTPTDKSLGARPGDMWILKHPVRDLPAPAGYRFRVSFEWIGPSGHVIGRAVRHSRSCYQPELRPDLLVGSIKITTIPSQPGEERYVTVIRNRGATSAGHFQVWFTYGSVLIRRAVQRLAAHSRIKETFVGPTCTAKTDPRVTVDPTHQVNDYNRSNNSRLANCSAVRGR